MATSKSDIVGTHPLMQKLAHITAKVAKLKARIYEVPISYSGRDYEEGKKIGLKDAFIAVWAIVRWTLFESMEPLHTTRKPVT